MIEFFAGVLVALLVQPLLKLFQLAGGNGKRSKQDVYGMDHAMLNLRLDTYWLNMVGALSDNPVKQAYFLAGSLDKWHRIVCGSVREPGEKSGPGTN
ncbi:hypothetical protein HDU99_005962 [Rhizoclosmatium hyalinum]|nr:hypothetical protein HDU99_005962 [Rhizoclosmatium hyalinum]